MQPELDTDGGIGISWIGSESQLLAASVTRWVSGIVRSPRIFMLHLHPYEPVPHQGGWRARVSLACRGAVHQVLC